MTEGSSIVLVEPATTTNLSVAVTGAGTSEVVFSLEYRGAIVAARTTAPPHSVTLESLGVGKYFLSARLADESNASADVSFDIRRAPLQPANDSWSQATALNGEIVQADNGHATAEPNELIHAGIGGGRTLWWKWQALSNGVVTITTAGSSFDTVLAIYTGTNVAKLAPVASNDDAGSTNRSSQVSFAASAGVLYSIAVDGAVSPAGSVSSGVVQLRLDGAVPPVITLAEPTNGAAFLVSSPNDSTNVSVSAAISDASGIAYVEYALDGGGLSRTGPLSSPYQSNLDGLATGDYLLTVTAVNTLGLISSEHVSFSVRPAAANILLVDSTPPAPAGFRFVVTGLKGASYELQSSTNVSDWNPLTRWTNFDGAQRVLDTNAPQFSARFYRVIRP